MNTFLVNQLVPMMHVTDVERSINFYELLGFTASDRMPSCTGVTCWASLNAATSRLFLTAADMPIVAEQQAVILYLYSHNVAALRDHLLAQGVANGGEFNAGSIPAENGGVVFDVVHPFYMPAGQIRIHDPDGYCLLVGQLG